jgi:hypothetical protein
LALEAQIDHLNSLMNVTAPASDPVPERVDVASIAAGEPVPSDTQENEVATDAKVRPCRLTP